MAEHDVGDVLGRDAELAQRAQDELPVGHHAGVDEHDPPGVAHQGHRPRHVRDAGVALDQDVDAGGAGEIGHPRTVTRAQPASERRSARTVIRALDPPRYSSR